MSLILVVLALLCELVAALSGFGWLVNAEHVLGWVALGFVFYFASLIVGPAMGLRRE